MHAAADCCALAMQLFAHAVASGGMASRQVPAVARHGSRQGSGGRQAWMHWSNAVRQACALWPAVVAQPWVHTASCCATWARHAAGSAAVRQAAAASCAVAVHASVHSRACCATGPRHVCKGPAHCCSHGGGGDDGGAQLALQLSNADLHPSTLALALMPQPWAHTTSWLATSAAHWKGSGSCKQACAAARVADSQSRPHVLA